MITYPYTPKHEKKDEKSEQANNFVQRGVRGQRRLEEIAKDKRGEGRSGKSRREHGRTGHRSGRRSLSR